MAGTIWRSAHRRRRRARLIEDIPFSETRGYVQNVLENTVVYDTLNPARAGQPQINRLSYYLGKRTPG